MAVAKFRARMLARKVFSFIPNSAKRLLPLPGRPPTVRNLMNRGIVTIGRHSYPDPPPVVYYVGDTARVSIGSFTSIAAGAELLAGGEHHTDWITTFPLRIRLDLPGKLEDGQPGSRGDIIIGDDVWLGRHCRVMSGVTIGSGAIVAAGAAGAVVTKDVAPYAVVGGVPARVLRMRYDDEQIEALLKIKWWEWSDKTIRERVGELSSPNISEFIRKYSE